MKITKAVAAALALACAPAASQAADIYVSVGTGNNANPGTKAQPLKDLHRALDKAAPGDSIHVAEGVYEGKLKSGYYEIEKSGLKLIGGYKADFSARAPFQYMSKIQDTSRSTSMGNFYAEARKNIEGVTIDGFVIDKAVGNHYGPKGLEVPGVSGTTAINLQTKGGATVVQNCIIVNNGGQGIKIDFTGGDVKVRNNLIVNTYLFGVSLEKTGSAPAKAEVSHNTIALTWKSDDADLNHGAAVEAHTDDAETLITGNVFALNDLTGLKNYRGAKKISATNNVFYGNKKGAYYFYMKDGNRMPASVADLGDTDLAGESGNSEEDPKLSNLDAAFVQNWATFSEGDLKIKNTYENMLKSVLGNRPLDAHRVGGKGMFMPKLDLKAAMLFAQNAKFSGWGAQMKPVQ